MKLSIGFLGIAALLSFSLLIKEGLSIHSVSPSFSFMSVMRTIAHLEPTSGNTMMATRSDLSKNMIVTHPNGGKPTMTVTHPNGGKSTMVVDHSRSVSSILDSSK